MPACLHLLCRLIVNKPLGTDLQNLHERLEQLQGGGDGGGGALGGLGAGGASALFGLGGAAAPGAGGVLPGGVGGPEAAAAASSEDDGEDIPAESLQQVGRAAVGGMHRKEPCQPGGSRHAAGLWRTPGHSAC